MSKASNEGLSLGYRFTWRLKYLLFGFFGPAQLGTEDPRSELVEERRAKVEQARAARGGSASRADG